MAAPLVPAELEAGAETAASIKPLSNDIFALCTSAAYDDMNWSQIDRALTLASAKVKLVIQKYGSLDQLPI